MLSRNLVQKKRRVGPAEKKEKGAVFKRRRPQKGFLIPRGNFSKERSIGRTGFERGHLEEHAPASHWMTQEFNGAVSQLGLVTRGKERWETPSKGIGEEGTRQERKKGKNSRRIKAAGKGKAETRCLP